MTKIIFTERLSFLSYFFPKKFGGHPPWGQCYKTFHGRNLRIFVIARAFVRGQYFQPSIMFVCKAYRRVEHLKDASLGRLPALPTNIRLDWKGWTGTNVLTYYENS